MKKLLIVLIDDPALDKSSTGCYMPGDTIAGNVTFHTSSSIKYTCIKIRFAGIVSTKVSKTTEDVYVLNQQVVLLGNANNASEFALQKGKYSWPFEFSVPWQHIPSSGKYRHGAVKYTLTATVSSKTFLGGMQETETNQTVQLKDLINCSQEPYSNPISVVGSSNTKPQTNKPKNLASATVQLSQSAYMKGQRLPITIDLAHTKGIQRDPGCWIQLLRKERYHAGEHDKEYTHICGTATEALYVDSGTNRGKILTHLNISDDALPTMTTTRIISMEYRLLILFDMRLRTGFMEGRARRTVNRKLRTKLLAAPGGFEIEVPVIIGTASENQYKPRLNPFDKTSSMWHLQG
ncbi:hypothetical protein BGZ54_004472 [Gamsiella multidivaricata]|nr:hypothetical protein BGZ54_004472 [Gamsiella multidivaricata]